MDRDYSRVGLPGDYCPPGHEIRKVFEAIAPDEVPGDVYQIVQRIDNPYVMLALRLAVYLLCLCAFEVGEADETGWVYQCDGIFATWPLSYVGSCHWAVTQMQGSAEIMPGNFRERAVSALHYQMSIIVLALVISKLTSVLQEMSDMKQKEQEVVIIA